MRKFQFLLLTSVFSFLHLSAFGAVREVTDVYLDLNRLKDTLVRPVNAMEIGLIIAGRTDYRYVDLVLNNRGTPVLKVPVRIKMWSVGATFVLSDSMDGKMSLRNVDGKMVEQLIGRYVGGKASASIHMAGLGGFAAANRHGVILRNIEGKYGLFSADVSVPVITLEKTKEYRADQGGWVENNDTYLQDVIKIVE